MIEPTEIFNLRQLVASQEEELEDFRTNSIRRDSYEYRKIEMNACMS